MLMHLTQFVRDKVLNNYVDKNTKVVYINNNKVQTYRSDWEFTLPIH